MVRDRVADIIFGTIFLFGGLAACSIAVMRRGSGVRALIWLGIWSAMYGAQPLTNSLAAVVLLPHWFQVSLPYVDTIISYLILVVASLAFLELSLSILRFWLQAVICVGLALTHKEIAQMIGTSRETVTRLLTDFKKKHLLRVKGSTLIIKNKAGLQSVVGS